MAMIVFNTMQPNHWAEVKKIYDEGIATGNATFQQSAPEWEEWNKSHLATCRIIAKDENKIQGWAALIPVSGRCVYAGVAEVSDYINTDARGKGIGRYSLQWRQVLVSDILYLVQPE